MNTIVKPDEKEIIRIVSQALNEDIGNGDITSECTVSENAHLRGIFLAKSEGIIAGLDVVKNVYKMIDKEIRLDFDLNEGDAVKFGDRIGTVEGYGRSILSGERVALNFMQRMSGIATMTFHFKEAVKETSAVILDTRKTVPGIRIFDKWAVRIGGGRNHRMGLYDMALIKENHITASGGLKKAVDSIRLKYGKDVKIEIETKNLRELKEALTLPVDMIMLDNFSIEDMQKAVNICNGKIPLEASGNVTLQTVRKIAETGVNFISAGILTHSVKALDISLIIDELHRS